MPNLLTTGNLFWGFFSIMKSLQGQFGWAASAILLAAVFDMLDGRVARLTNGTSEFGVQYDSLCDLFSFGGAPALLAYQYGLHNFGRIGWVVCFLFLACGALRLARFNVQSSIGQGSGDFTGLPIPMAAAVIATYVACMTELELLGNEGFWLGRVGYQWLGSIEVRPYFLVIAAPLLALAMVSNIVYRSHKAIKFKGVSPFNLLAISVFIIAVFAYQPEIMGFAFCLFYALSGLVEWALGLQKPTEDRDIFASVDEDKSIMEPDD